MNGSYTFFASFYCYISILALWNDCPPFVRSLKSPLVLHTTVTFTSLNVPPGPLMHCSSLNDLSGNVQSSIHHASTHTRSPNSKKFLQSNANAEYQLSTQKRTFQDAGTLSYESAIEALLAFRKVHGNLVIPKSFVVPETQDYPVEWHGIKLAKHVYNMKWWQTHVSGRSDRVAHLNELGFIWERLQPEWNLFMEGLVYYSSMHGDVMVPSSFVVPQDEVWPKAIWGFPLGNYVYRVRFRHDFLQGEHAHERKNQLDGLGFVWDLSEHNFLIFFNALRHFDKLEKQKNWQSTPSREHSIIRVPSKFIVPSGHEHGWPKELWGYSLGAKCMAVRQKQLYVKNKPDRKRALEDIGFRWSGNATLGWLDVVHAAAIYSQMHGRILNVPFNFVVPAPPSSPHSNSEDCWPWPEQLWGLKLGQRLKDVRLKGAYLKGPDAQVRRAQLDALGFVWNPKRGRRKRFLGDGSSAE